VGFESILMKIVIASLALLAAAATLVSRADNGLTNAAPSPSENSAAKGDQGRPENVPTNAEPRQRRARRSSNPTNDFFYHLVPDSKPMAGVPHGRFVGPKILPSNVFPGTQHTYWVYVPAQYDPSQPTALMVFNDGQAMMAEPGDVQAQYVLDNLIYRREIPVMLGVFINPGRRPDQPEPTPKDWGDRSSNRPDEYNPPTDKYARVILDELMPALKEDYNISPDPNLHGIMGASSGGCAAFAVAWFRPNDFHKVITVVGSFTNIRGEYVYPELVAQSEKKPIRIFMQDGRNDNRRPDDLKWDWFYQSVRLMKALTDKGYDVNYAWGIGNHGQKQGGAIFPDMMRWLWRDQPVSTDPNDAVERGFRASAAPSAEAAAKPN
jgi:enterochelin esterase-like enzyme